VSEPVDQDLVGSLAAQRDARAQSRLGRSLAVFPLATGDCGGCMLEWAMLRHTALGLGRYGLTVLDTPVGADVMLVTGAMTRNLVAPVQRALLAMATPRWVIAIGDCALDGGLFAGSPAVAGGTQAAIPVDLAVPGCPPTPEAMLAALRALLAVNTEK
jgi:Ni,Fe-hydrogenase III small subunit